MAIKSELIDKICKKTPSLPEKVIAICVNQIIDTMTDALVKGQRIEIRGFGGFTLRYRASRNAHNPKTGEKVITLPKFILRFKAGKDMRLRIDAGKDKPIISESEE